MTRVLASSALVLLLAPSLAEASHPSALFGGLRIGGVVRDRAEAPPVAFRLGATLDYATSFGPAASLRIDVTDRIESATSLGFGWYGDGMFDVASGVPLGVFAGPLYDFDKTGVHRAGGRLHVTWGLWLNRATLDLDVDVVKPIRLGARPEHEGVEVVVGVALRIVPLAPLAL